ncbi:3-keto-5-aminohexanoate cleavage protein [Sanguibacter sp. 25GB23B1]|uniref:3-keto-5-aminohexanoate cleavage protein n=1 Tax=unclassified Sanguibacter TaxID=2645534 RepID=UPI0032B011F3
MRRSSPAACALLVKAALNGNRGREEHPALPVTPDELARDAVAVRRAGAGAVHVHPRSATGQDSLVRSDVAAAVGAVRAAAPGLAVGVTTGAWAAPGPDDRIRQARSWAGGSGAVRPDFASVNWHEDGADEVADALVAAGVGVEAGLFHLDALESWTRWPQARRGCVRVLLELPDGLDETGTAAYALAMIGAVRAFGTHAPVLLHGEGTSCWPALRLAVELRLDTRIGLEDTLLLPDGAPARDNAALVEAALAIVSERGPAPV